MHAAEVWSNVWNLLFSVNHNVNTVRRCRVDDVMGVLAHFGNG